ncbi:MAG TPA: hypothetical protein VGW38_16275 [Chloroflexota bacterium]|nr:hypothetical protein [Chloroflexota bacterium]
MGSVVEERCLHCEDHLAQSGSPFCAACETMLQELSARHREKMAERKARRQRQEARAKELGLSDSGEYATFTQSGSWFGPEWNGWMVENVGVPAGCDSFPPPWPFWRFTREDGSGGGGLLYHIWGRRVFPPGSSAYLDARWDPNTGREQIALLGLENVANDSEVTRAQRGLKQLRKVDATAGRPAGSGWPVTAEAVTREFWRHVEEYGKPPAQKDPDLAARFFLGTRQFQNRLSELKHTEGLTWPPPRPE